MISILIPVYNYNVNELVNDLIRQLKKLNIEFEIVICDDASDVEYKEKNRQLSQLPGIKYFEENINIGRSLIRNKLARLASYEILIFIDSDISIKNNDNFIENYINSYNPEYAICGGIIYDKNPLEKKYILRWKYGIKREMKFLNKKNQSKYIHFFTGNFLINKNVFFKIKFDENLKNYGYEDTLFAYKLMKNGIGIKYINNPVLHNIKVENKVYLEKSLFALKNLLLIYENISDYDFIEKIKILKVFYFIKKLKIDKVFLIFYKVFENLIHKHLVNSNNPSLILFDFYRLGYLCYLNNIKK